MRDLQTMKKMNEEFEARALHPNRDFIRFRHDEVMEMLRFLTIVQNPGEVLRNAIRKLEMIHELQVESHKRAMERER